MPESGKKADLMFVQHMVASLKSDGKMAVVMPHGVLFRGGEEKACRQRFIKDGILEAVIGLPSNLFYGTGIPACVLVINRHGAKQPQARPLHQRRPGIQGRQEPELAAARRHREDHPRLPHPPGGREILTARPYDRTGEGRLQP